MHRRDRELVVRALSLRGWWRLAALAAALSLSVPAAAADDATCPSLAGRWSGNFDGSARGSWAATFQVDGASLRATAKILVVGAGAIEGVGTARLTCKDGKLSLVGEGRASGRSGTFHGFAHADGDHLVGSWNAGGFSGTWNGRRAEH